MWNYERRLEYPVNISRCNPQAAMVIMSQYGGLYSIRYKFFMACIQATFLNQFFSFCLILPARITFK